MRLLIFYFSVATLLNVAGVSCCRFSDNAKSPRFLIEKQGMLYPDEFFPVIDVYGFNDNEQVAKEIIQHLNQTEQRANYRYRPSTN